VQVTLRLLLSVTVHVLLELGPVLTKLQSELAADATPNIRLADARTEVRPKKNLLILIPS
jgi:hypothetical protein